MKMSYTLRPRQEEAVNKIDTFITNSKKNHGLFVYPTSFGKSLVISNLASKYPNKYFINVTNSKELLKQNYEKYTSYGFEAEICSASLNSNNNTF
jgi:DNA repair protein RadD